MNTPNEVREISFPEFMQQAQAVVDNIPSDFRGQRGSVFVMDDINTFPIEEFRDHDGTVYIGAKESQGQLVPTDVELARSRTTGDERIVLSPSMQRHHLYIAFDEEQVNATDEQFLKQPYLVISYIDLGDHRVVIEARCFYQHNFQSYLSIEELAKAAEMYPSLSLTKARGLADGEVNLPLTFAQYMTESQTLLDQAFEATTEGRQEAGDASEHPEKPVTGPKGIDREGLRAVLASYRDRLIRAAKINSPNEQLAKALDTPGAEDERERLIQTLTDQARRNTDASDIFPYTFEEVMKCIYPKDLIEALAQIPEPHLHLLKDTHTLRISSGRSLPDTYGMNYEDAAALVEKLGLVLSPKEHAHFDQAQEQDAWIQGSMASGKRITKKAGSRPYYHPEIGAHVSRDIPMDTKKLNPLETAAVIWRRVASIFRG